MRWMGVVGVVLLLGCRQGRPGRTGQTTPGDPTDGGVSEQGDGGATLPDGGHAQADAGDPEAGIDAGTDGGVFTGPRWPPSRAGYVNPIPGENAHQGDPDWRNGYTNAW